MGVISNLQHKLIHSYSLQYAQVIRVLHYLLINILLVKLGVDKEQIGYYELLLIVAGAITFFWVGGLTKGFIYQYNSHDEPTKKQVVLYNFFLVCVMFVTLSVLILLLFRNGFYQLFNAGDSIPHYHLLILYTCFNVTSLFLDYVLYVRNLKRTLYLFASFYYLLQLVVFTLVLFLTQDVFVAFWVLIGFSFVRLIYLSVLCIPEAMQRKINFEIIGILLKSSWPLIVSAFVAGSATYIDSVLVTKYFGIESLAIFRYGSKQFPLFLILSSTTSLSIIAHLSKAENSGDFAYIRRYSGKLLNLFFIISVVLIIIARPAFEYVFDPTFAESAHIFQIYTFIALSKCLFPQSILIANNKNHHVLWVSFMELFVNIGTSILFLNMFGLIGIALGSVVANYFEKIVLSIMAVRTCHLTINSFFMSFRSLIYLTVLIVIYYFVMP